MTSILLQDPTVALALGAVDPEERFTITGVDWSQYEHFLVTLGDRVRYRVTYLAGMLEIWSPLLPTSVNSNASLFRRQLSPGFTHFGG
jgi:hypothetical protein